MERDQMAHFAIVQALCRAAMANPTDAVKRQIQRLQEALQEDGDSKSAKALASILSDAQRSVDLLPSRLTRSTAVLAGEPLTRQVAVPVDRETAVPLAEVVFPDDISGDPPVLENDLHEAVISVLYEWQHAEILRDLDVRPSMSCLIYGSPGTGKTRLALWMAKQLGLPAVVARLDGLISSFLGTTSRNIGALFSFAGRYRCLLLLDEFDAIAKVRDDPQEVGEIKRVVNTLLQNLDARRQHGITIGITNHEHLLDTAVWRRFEVQLSIPKPSLSKRVEIARKYLEPLNLEDPEVRFLAWLMEGTPGSEIESLARSLKKSHALSGGDDLNVLSALRQFATVSSGRLNGERRSLLFVDEQELARTLMADSDLRFDQTDVAALIHRNKATVSRWMKGRAAR